MMKVSVVVAAAAAVGRKILVDKGETSRRSRSQLPLRPLLFLPKSADVAEVEGMKTVGIAGLVWWQRILHQGCHSNTARVTHMDYHDWSPLFISPIFVRERNSQFGNLCDWAGGSR